MSHYIFQLNKNIYEALRPLLLLVSRNFKISLLCCHLNGNTVQSLNEQNYFQNFSSLLSFKWKYSSLIKRAKFFPVNPMKFTPKNKTEITKKEKKNLTYSSPLTICVFSCFCLYKVSCTSKLFRDTPSTCI